MNCNADAALALPCCVEAALVTFVQGPHREGKVGIVDAAARVEYAWCAAGKAARRDARTPQGAARPSVGGI
jgi:hypothetical protein